MTSHETQELAVYAKYYTQVTRQEPHFCISENNNMDNELCTIVLQTIYCITVTVILPCIILNIIRILNNVIILLES